MNRYTPPNYVTLSYMKDGKFHSHGFETTMVIWPSDAERRFKKAGMSDIRIDGVPWAEYFGPKEKV